MTTQTHCAFKTTVSLPFQEAVGKVTELLKEQGFGILTTIDVQAKMKEKLDKAMDEYLILGACNPKLASQALDAARDVGLMMPCNVVLYRQDDQTVVAVQRPSTMMSALGNKEVCMVADQAEEALKKVVDGLSDL